MKVEENINLGIIIQARIGSQRLPGKMLLPFYDGKGIFELLIEKIQKVNIGVPIVLATSNTDKDSVLVDLAEKYGVLVFRGSENDVLERFIGAAELFNINKIIRVCADNPFLDIDSLCELLEEIKTTSVDYLAFRTSSGIPTIRTHYGFWPEGVSLDALLRVRKMTNEMLYHEHVTNFIYLNPELFTTSFVEISPEIENSNIRMTLDTEADFDILKDIYCKFNFFEDQSLESLIRFVVKNDEWIQVMSLQISINSK